MLAKRHKKRAKLRTKRTKTGNSSKKRRFVLTHADGTVEIVEVKSKFTRRMQRDYIYRRRLFIDLVAEPRGWKFTEWFADKED